jgi:hypothetical protein
MKPRFHSSVEANTGKQYTRTDDSIISKIGHFSLEDFSHTRQLYAKSPPLSKADLVFSYHQDEQRQRWRNDEEDGTDFSRSGSSTTLVQNGGICKFLRAGSIENTHTTTNVCGTY